MIDYFHFFGLLNVLFLRPFWFFYLIKRCSLASNIKFHDWTIACSTVEMKRLTENKHKWIMLEVKLPLMIEQ